MTTPISGNSPGGIGQHSSARPEAEARPKEAGNNAAAPGPQVAAEQRAEVSISRAAELLAQSQTRRSGGGVDSPEQAAQLAQQLKAQIQADPQGALASQAAAVGVDLMDLLKAS